MKRKEYLLPGGVECAVPGCDWAAEYTCDNCDSWVCEEHIHRFRGHSFGDTDQCEQCVEKARLS